jgi:hypothetical protein
LQGYNCNLKLVGQFDNNGEGAGWQHAWFDECSYMGTADASTRDGIPVPRPGQLNPGVAVIDTADSTNPLGVARLTSLAMLDPWESLKFNENHALLGAWKTAFGGNLGEASVDFYDISDCAKPQLLSSGPIGTTAGHAGHFAPDGLTYYSSQNQAQMIKAIGLEDPSAPNLLMEPFPIGTHDLSVSADGNRAYLANNIKNGDNSGGLDIIDISDIQQRKPNPEIRIISELYWQDGSTVQHSQPLTITGRPYILLADESGKGAVRLADVSDETQAFLTAKLKLEVHMLENADAIEQDTTTEPIFAYEGHYCTVSDGIHDTGTYTIDDAVIAVCGKFHPASGCSASETPINRRKLPTTSRPPHQVSSRGRIIS